MNLKALWFLAVSALGLGYLPAMAADLIIDTPAVDPEPDTSVVDWTGFYVGLGLSKGRIEFGLDTLELVLDGQEQDYGVFDNSVGVALLAGYNVQLDQLVLGGELEVDLLGPASLGTYDIDTGDFENAFATCSYGADPACAEFSVLGALDMKGRLRVTAGMEVAPGLMVFLSGGLSVADASVAGYKVLRQTPIPPLVATHCPRL